MKKFLTGLIILLVFFLAACGKQEDNKTVLKFSSWGSRTEYSILKQVISDYEKSHPDVKIELIHVPENYFRKLHLLFAAKSAPDVVFVNNTYAPLYIKAGLLEDLSNLVEEKEYFPSALNCFKYDKKLYVVPRDISNLVIYINKNYVKNPEKIKTIYDLRQVAKETTNRGIYGFNYEKQPLFWLYFLEYFNGGILSENSEQVILNSPESIQGLQFYADMINKDKSVPQEWQMAGMTSAQMFINGKITMYLSGRWLVPKFRETVKFDWDVIPFPQSETSKTLTDASGWAVSKSSQNKEIAFDFVKYLASEKTSLLFAQTGLITPARKDTANSIEFLAQDLKPHNAKAFINSVENSKPTPVNENYAQIIDEVTKNITPVLNGKSTARKTMTETFINKLQKYCNKKQ